MIGKIKAKEFREKFDKDGILLNKISSTNLYSISTLNGTDQEKIVDLLSHDLAPSNLKEFVSKIKKKLVKTSKLMEKEIST